jgi:hypothetical protein
LRSTSKLIQFGFGDSPRGLCWLKKKVHENGEDPDWMENRVHFLVAQEFSDKVAGM